ncbi:NAD(P)H-binding protein [Zavarzinia aquatilis]|uniref:NAD-dependent dehydratase n=1 Tax=Zavarzinia aquatilis TaxID=2211142 RepID=A0A317EF50_9PROT|nr:NAD(P)H-binding protein [Zavarzinia aquatilis]PWR25627.1 NAD-dependent dehydratase [Zavarzinia aquatilis]
MKFLLLGATGAVGRAVLRQLLADDAVTAVIAPTRRPLTPAPKLTNPLTDFAALPGEGDIWQADAVVSALGTTQKIAGSRDAFRRVDLDLVIATAAAARRAGSASLAVVSSVGAASRSPSFYLRTKGEMEAALRALGYPSLTIVRPSMIDARRDPPRGLEEWGTKAFRLFAPLIPARYRAVTPEQIARTLIAAARAAAPGVRVIESEDIG